MHITEPLFWLTRSYWCYAPDEPSPPIGELPSHKNGYITFGSVNNPAKYSESAIDLWGAVLWAVPRSQLMLLVHEKGGTAPHLLSQFAARGVAADRIVTVGKRPRHSYFELY